jgi:transposase
MTKTEQTRLTSWRLKVVQRAAEDSRNVARTCRHFGISRQAFYKWKRRFAEHGEAGLCDRPRRPTRSPHATPKEVVSKILYLRQNYHFGPGKIADYLKRFHELAIAKSSVHRILGAHGMNRLPANQKHRPHKQRWKHYEKAQPGHRLQLDVKFLERIPGTRKRLFHSPRSTIARAFACSRCVTTPAIKPETTRFPAIFCTFGFGSNFLPVLGFEVRERCEWLRVAASKRRRGVTPGSPRTTSCAKNIG